MTTNCTMGRRQALQGNFYAGRSTSCAVAFLVMLFAASEAKGIVIDDFEDGSGVDFSDTTPDGSVINVSESGLSGVLGGTRNILIGLNTGAENTLFNATHAPNGGDDGISYTISAGATGIGNTNYGFPSTDFEAAGHDRFIVTFLTPTPSEAIFLSVVNTMIEFSPTVPAGTSTLILPYSSHGTFSPGDFSAVTQYQLTLVVDTEPPGIRTFTISDIRTAVPEPSHPHTGRLGPNRPTRLWRAAA